MKHIKWYRRDPINDRTKQSVSAILSASYILLCEKNYSAISLEEIITKSGLSQTYIYKFYESLEHIYADVLENILLHRKDKGMIFYHIDLLSSLLPIAIKFKIKIVPDVSNNDELTSFYSILLKDVGGHNA